MKRFAVAIVLFLCSFAHAQLDEVLKHAEGTLDHRDTSSLSNSKITSGLKQALQVSTGNAVALTGKPDGFLKNEAIKILLPPRFETFAKALRMFGMAKPFTTLQSGMNRPTQS